MKGHSGYTRLDGLLRPKLILPIEWSMCWLLLNQNYSSFELYLVLISCELGTSCLWSCSTVKRDWKSNGSILNVVNKFTSFNSEYCKCCRVWVKTLFFKTLLWNPTPSLSLPLLSQNSSMLCKNWETICLFQKRSSVCFIHLKSTLIDLLGDSCYFILCHCINQKISLSSTHSA